MTNLRNTKLTKMLIVDNIIKEIQLLNYNEHNQVIIYTTKATKRI